MRLVDLDPHWIGIHDWSENSPYHVGITFRCPHCPPGKRGETTFIAVFFSNPIDPGQLQQKYSWTTSKLAENLWNRQGDTFDTLTLSPSVDASGNGHWHGFITNGEVV